MTSDGAYLLELSFAEPDGECKEAGAEKVFAQTGKWLDAYFAGAVLDPPPLKWAGTPFQELVWRLLLEIPYGESTTYGALARKAAALSGKARMSAQAVGQAVGKNPLCLIIPCHRVLGSKGELTGYAWGLERKQALLALEQRQKKISK